MKKKLKICTLFTAFTALMLGAFAFRMNQEPQKVEAVSTVDSQLYSVQVRSGGSDLNYLTVLDESIDVSGVMMSVSGRNYNAPDYINVYLSPEGEAISLSSFIDEDKLWDINLWSSGGVMFHISDDDFETYNGTTVYAIEVLAGCTYPNSDLNTVVVSATRKFINKSYGNPDAKNEAFYFVPATDPLVNLGNVELSWIHNRMDHNSGQRWLMFMVSEEIFNTQMDVTSWMNELNFFSNVLIYFSKEGEPITLSEIYDPSSTGVTLQLFGQRNVIAVSISNEELDGQYRYCGPKMYKITFNEGTQIPTYESDVAGYRLVSKETSFINYDYGKYGEIPGDVDDDGNPRLYEEWNINWKVEVEGLVNLGEIGINGVHNRMDKDSGYRWMMFMLDNSIYNVNLDVSEWIEELNFMDNISIYFSEDGEPVRIKDIYDPTATGVTIQLFGQKNMFAISISNEVINGKYRYAGPEMFKIIIEAGTKVPAYENGVAGYRVIGEKTILINGDYQLYGEIDDTIDDYGNPRVYEEWNVNWTLASCYVTFTVVGVEGVSYPDMLLEYGQRVYLEDFAIDGYDLVATTSAGDTIYQCIIGTNHNLNVILTYSTHKGNGNASGCAGSVVTGSLIISMVSLMGLVLIIRRRKGNEHER